MSTKFQGIEVPLKGNFPAVGTDAKDFVMVKGDLGDWKLSEQTGTIILNIYPSIDTGICAMSTERFNKEAASLADVQIVCISKDLPFAQSRFCKEKGIDKIATASGFRNSSFGSDYGVEIAAGPMAGLYARAVIIVKDAQVIYTELVAEITQEPNYEAALAALK